MNTPDASEHLKKYISEKLANFVPAQFEEGLDIPSFAVDQTALQLGILPYKT